MQTTPSKQDIYRAWYEERYNGSLSKSNPYQSALCCAAMASTSDLETIITDTSVDFAMSGLNHYGELFSTDLAGETSTGFLGEDNPSDEFSSELVDLFLEKMSAFPSTSDGHAAANAVDVEIGLSLAADLLVASMAPDIEMSQSVHVDVRGDVHGNGAKRSRNDPPASTVGDAAAPESVVGRYGNTSTASVPPGPGSSNCTNGHDIKRNVNSFAIPAPVHVPAPATASASDDHSGGLNKRFKSAKQEFVAQGGSVSSLPKGTKPSLGPSLGASLSSSGSGGDKDKDKPDLPPELQQFEKALVERVEADIIASGKGAATSFDDIAGLEFAKKCVQEVICWPMLRPDLFTGLRALPKGVLLFGPPGTGKTLIGKAIAHQVGATFFSISASSLTSKWIGEGERLVRTLFGVAVYRQPAIIFIDEVDSLLSSRSEGEAEASRRMKTEFLVQLDGAGTDDVAQVIILGATNRPDELDDAARRRFVKRIYVPLPDIAARRQMVYALLGLAGQKAGTVDAQGRRSAIYHQLSEEDVDRLVGRTAGYSGADIKNLCTEAAMGPVREVSTLHGNNLRGITANEFPPIIYSPHIEEALDAVSATVSTADLRRYIAWNETFGTYRKLQIEIDE